MGAAQSSFDTRHVRIWNNLASMESTSTRMAMLDTLFNGQEYVTAAKRAGLYAGLLQWVSAQRRGEYCPWPTFGQQVPLALPAPVITRAPPMNQTALATIAPPKRALDALHAAYDQLGIDDSKHLTHELLRTAYKKAASKSHPDKGGSAKEFDNVTRAFHYLEEVLNKLAPKAHTSDRLPTNKLIMNPGITDHRLSAPVSMETALAHRAIATTTLAKTHIDEPVIALNPKKLDMTMFNRLFEQNKLPDPEADDGYGDWLKENSIDKPKTADGLRSKYNADVFNKMFEDEARRGTQGHNSYVPNDMVMSPGFGTEIGSGRPSQYTQIVGAGGIGYTDLKYAYGEGSTFSQQVADVNIEGRPKTLEQAKMEYGAAPKPMTAQQLAAEEAYNKSRDLAEKQRLERMTARDVDAETLHNRMKSRISIQ